MVSALKMSNNVGEKFRSQFQARIIKNCSNRGELLNYISVLININEEQPDLISDELKIFILQIINTLFEQENKKEE